jgi:cytochrome c-type biogenesis protein
MDTFYLVTAFGAGLVSFLAPCVLPIIPGFLAYLGGVTTGEQKSNRKELFLNSLFFVLGFSVIFALLGVLLQTVLRNVGPEIQTWLGRIGGLIIIIFGLYLVGLLHIGFLEKSYAVKAKKFSSRYLTSFVFGLAFAVGWTPCAGAVLGGILALAVTSPVSSFFLLLSYSLGLGVPFLIVGLFTDPATRFINKFGTASVIINKAFGVILILLGVLVFTDNIALLGNFEVITSILHS